METSKHNKLSVVVLSFNTPTLTKQTLQSVSLSDHTSLELICVDDGSRPEAVEELASYCRTNGITFLSNGKNRGIPASCNIGLQAATGEFISVIGDDLVLPRRYSDDVQILSENLDCGFVCSQVSLIDEANTPLLGFESWTNSGVEGRFLETPEKVLLRGSKALTPTLTFRTALLRAIGGWDEEYLIEDKPLLIKLAKLKVAGYFYARQSTLYRRYSGNLTGRFRTSAYAEDLALLKQYDLKVSLGSFQ
jgi:GT2 family glycosyltransferase